MAKICKVLGIITEILGVIGSFNLAKTFGTVSSGLLHSYTEMNWGVAIAVFLGGVITTSAMAFLLIGLSEVLNRLSDVEYTLDQTRRELEKQKESVEDTDSKSTWKCPICGKNNPMYTGTCSCGQERF